MLVLITTDSIPKKLIVRIELQESGVEEQTLFCLRLLVFLPLTKTR